MPVAGQFLVHFPRAARQASRMFIGGSSRGNTPTWINRLLDFGIHRMTNRPTTEIIVDAPTIKEAAPHLFDQQEFWSTKPNPKATALDLLGYAVRDVAKQHPDSDILDRSLLNKIARFDNVLDGCYSAVVLDGLHSRAVRVHSVVTNRAHQWAEETPLPQTARIVGKLDLLWLSARVFGLILDNGRSVRGVVSDGDIAPLSALFKQRVAVSGTVYYRPSGTVQRIEATSIIRGDDESTLWSRVPEPASQSLDRIRAGANKSGWANMAGKWPGDETEEELLGSLHEFA